MTQSSDMHAHLHAEHARWRTRINAEWHETALRAFTAIVLFHWAEHLAQAVQVFLLHWPLPESRGVLGLWFPWLINSEVMHYGYAAVMLFGLWYLLPGFVGRAKAWWTASLVIQFWHHIEHALLQGQALMGHNLFGAPVPMSIAQVWVPRVELHLFYNSIVFVPMVIGMYYHLFPDQAEARQMKCQCAVRPRQAMIA